MAMDQPPFAIDLSKELGHPYAHVGNMRHVPDLRCCNLEPGPEAQLAAVTFLDDLKVSRPIVKTPASVR